MNVINQVLNQLERRGVYTAAEQTMVRAVPHARDIPRVVISLLVLALGLAVLAWKWLPTSQSDVAAMSHGLSESIAASGVADEPRADTTASRLSFELSSVSLPRPHDPSISLGAGVAQGGHRSGQALHVKKNVIAKQFALVPEKSVNPISKTLSGQNNLPVAHPVSLADGVPVKQFSARQRADSKFRKAIVLMQHGHIAEASAGYETALRMDAGHDQARQALVALLLEGKRGTDAERVLQEGLKNKPANPRFAMMLARLQVERGAVSQAMATLEKYFPYAERQADYQAFFAALLQRQNRNAEAILHYQIALKLVPNNAIWQMGYGISLQAMQRNAEAKAAYKRALDAQTLTSGLQAFVRQKVKGL